MNRFVSASLFVFLSALLSIVAGCSSGSDGEANGTLSVVLTDGATDELSQFEVDVSNIVLTKLSGATVSVMPRTTRVDFIELESVNELIAGIDLEAGAYSRVALTLDFSNAEVLLVGQTTPAAIQNAQGAPITGPVEVAIDFAPGSRLLVRPGRNNLFALDLELDQSVSVDPPTNTITFTPVLTVQVDPSNPKPIATTGLLQSVDAAAQTFVVERRDLGGNVIYTFTVATGATTVFQLDGVVQLGATGLAALAANVGDRVFVQGTLDVGTARLLAVAVESGAGVPGNGQDWVLGHVVARSGAAGGDATLSVLGRSLDVGTGTRTYNTAHTVNVSLANTKVLRRGAGNSLDSDDVAIGQLVWVFGDLSGTTLDATAATGVARLLRTAIFGIAASAAVNDTLTLDVVRFDWRVVGAFDFNVSGQVQADPTVFPVDVTGLSTTGITAGSRVRAFGWIAPVGSSGAEATATSLVDRTNGGKVLFCLWATPSATAMTATPAVTLTGIATADIKVVGDGFAPVTLTETPAPTVQALGAVGFYRIVQDNQVVAYLDFTAFRTALALRLGSANVFAVAALGTFDASTQVFSALTATVVLD